LISWSSRCPTRASTSSTGDRRRLWRPVSSEKKGGPEPTYQPGSLEGTVNLAGLAALAR
jgi:hypothetical protein